MIEAAWLKNCAGDVKEVWAKCASCHSVRMVATNIRDPPEGQPFCSCPKCGQFLFAPDAREKLIDMVVDHGWSRAIVWLMAQNIGDEHGDKRH